MNTANNNLFMIDLLRRYIQIRTVHPDANYQGVVDLFTACAHKDGFISRQINLASGFPTLVITYEGSQPQLPSLILHHHMDVVPAADETLWKSPPFAGDIIDGHMIGRGTQDMKGLGVVHYAALKALKDQGILPERTIHLCIVPDEERGGFEGMQQFVSTPLFTSLNAGFVFDEGLPSGNDTFLYYKVTERNVLQVRIQSTGTLAHGSQLMADNPVHTLIEFLTHVVALQRTAQQNISSSQPGLHTSFNITSLYTGTSAVNIIPATAHATLDIRIAHTQDIQEVRHKLQQVASLFPTIHIEEIASSYVTYNTKDTAQTSDWFLLVSDVLKTYNLEIRPLHFEATTDVRYYKALGIDGSGFTPFRTANNLHGVNESVPIADLQLARDIMVDILKKSCCTGRIV